MKRLTKRLPNGVIHVDFAKQKESAIRRLAAIEDILGDEYELDDVAPVRYGRWIDAESDDGCTVWHCSKCSYPIKTICGYPIYKYCPMCGALMDGKEADHEIS